MKRHLIIGSLIINTLFFSTVSAQETVEKNSKTKKTYTSFDLQSPVHSIGLLFSENSSFIEPKYRNTAGSIQINNSSIYLSPELMLKYSCAIKNGWGIATEISLGSFSRYADPAILGKHIPKDTVWSNGVVGAGLPNERIEAKFNYLGFSLKASYLANVHKNISLQSEVGLKWLPFLTPAKKIDIDESFGEFIISDGLETDKLVYMNCKPTISAASYAVPDLALSFNVLVHGKNPANNFVFGLNANISFLDRFHFEYQTTNVLPEHLQSSGEFGWRMSSIGFHIGYQWISGKKKIVN